MKVIEKGAGWSIVKTCSGSGNGGGGCGAQLQVERGDLFRTSRKDISGFTEYYITFQCPDCGVLTDAALSDIPRAIDAGLPSHAEWKKLHEKPPERKVSVGVALIVTNLCGEVLMGQRKGSHGAGTWSLIGGWMRHGESFLDAAKREALEESGITVYDAHVVGTLNTVFKDQDVHSVTVLMHVTSWSGAPTHIEKDKLEGPWLWTREPPPNLFQPLADMQNPTFAELIKNLP